MFDLNDVQYRCANAINVGEWVGYLVNLFSVPEEKESGGCVDPMTPSSVVANSHVYLQEHC